MNSSEPPDESVPSQHIRSELKPVVTSDVTPIERASLAESELWGWSDLALFLSFAALAFLVSSIFVSVAYLALRSFAGWQTSPEAVQGNSIFLVAIVLVFYALLLGFVFVLVTAYHQQPFWSSLKWKNPTGRNLISYLIGGFLMALAVQHAPTLLSDRQDFPLQQMFSSPGAAYVLAAFAVLIAPFMEELVFRGVVFAVFERRIGITFATVTTALLFGALHAHEYRGAWNHLLLLFLVSAAFSLARALTGSLAPSVILHVAYNLSLMVGLYFQSDHFRALQSAPAAVFYYLRSYY